MSSVATSQKQNDLPFAPLLEGEEDIKSAKLRYGLFQEFWASQEQQIQVCGIQDDVKIRKNDSNFRIGYTT